MNIALWILQVILAAAFLMAGGMKLGAPIETLAKDMLFVTKVPAMLVRFIGLSEVLGGLGLLLPSILRIQPKLTPIAAGALALVMVLAAGSHVMMSDFKGVAPSIILGLLCGFVAWGRWSKHPIAPK